ncbi:MAG: PAS domain S-box protein [Chloroflexota bacterium]|nr:PAS domain S-box protein [Chloroflexota bacterium]
MDKDKARRRRLKDIVETTQDIAGEEVEPVKHNGDDDRLKERQEELENRLNQFLAMQRAFTSVQSTMDMGEVLSKIAETVVNILDYDHSFIIAFEEKKNSPVGKAFFSKEGLDLAREIEKLILPNTEDSVTQDSNEIPDKELPTRRDSQDASDETSFSLEYNAVQELLGSKSMITMPLIARERLVGNIFAFTNRADIAESGDEQLWALSNQAAIAIDNVRLYDEALVTAQKLRESREMSRVTLESAVTGVSIVQDNKFQYVNPIYEDLLGYSIDEILGTNADDYIHPEDRERVIEEAIGSLKEKTNLPHEFRLVRKDGGVVWVVEKVVSIKYRAKRAALGIVLDITELKRVEEALRESEEKLRIIFDAIKDGIVVTDLQINMVQANEAAIRLAGYATKEDMIGQNAMDFITAEDIEKALQPMSEAVQGRPIERDDFKLRNKLGEEFYAEIGISTFQDADGNLAGFVTIIRDVTERRLMEDLLRASEEKTRFIFESIGDGIVVTDLAGKVIDENQAGIRMFGYSSKEDFSDIDGLSFISEKDRETAMSSMMRAMNEGKGETMEFTLTDKIGKEFEGEISTAILRDDSGDPTGFICVIRDITVRKKMEQAKSDFVALVSHQLKTPVAGIKGYIENMLDGLAGDLTDKQKQYLADMRKLCLRNYSLISDLLNTSMIERGILTVDMGPTELISVINAVLEDYRGKIIEKGLTSKVDGCDKEIVVFADKSKLTEVLVNVVSNAIKFTDKGSISIQTRIEDNYGVIEVTDTGRGMADESMEDLFKREKVLSGGAVAGGGAGLGLYIAKGFMNAQKGDITATSRPGEGSTFVIKVPLLKESD